MSDFDYFMLFTAPFIILGLVIAVGSARTKLAHARGVLKNCREMIVHAQGLGYLGDGSTKGWADECLSEIAELEE